MDNLARLIRQFEASEEASQAGRREAERARDYYDGKQLTDEERKALRRRKQPPVIINRIQRKIDYLRGLERQNRTDPKAYPRTIRDEQDVAQPVFPPRSGEGDALVQRRCEFGMTLRPIVQRLATDLQFGGHRRCAVAVLAILPDLAAVGGVVLGLKAPGFIVDPVRHPRSFSTITLKPMPTATASQRMTKTPPC